MSIEVVGGLKRGQRWPRSYSNFQDFLNESVARNRARRIRNKILAVSLIFIIFSFSAYLILSEINPSITKSFSDSVKNMENFVSRLTGGILFGVPEEPASQISNNSQGGGSEVPVGPIQPPQQEAKKQPPSQFNIPEQPNQTEQPPEEPIIQGVYIIEETLTQQKAEINKPVKWTLKIKLNKETNSFKLKVPSQASNVRVREARQFGITGGVILENENNPSLLDVIKNFFRTITGFAAEDMQEVNITVNVPVSELEIEYETPAPTVQETLIREEPYQKQLKIFSELHYRDVFAYVGIPESSPEQILFTLIDNGRTKYPAQQVDTNNNSKIDRLEWTTDLSDKTFQVDILGTGGMGEFGIQATSVTDCETLSTPNEVYTLANNLSNNDTCITITANNITLNFNGYNISGIPPSPPCLGFADDCGYQMTPDNCARQQGCTWEGCLGTPSQFCYEMTNEEDCMNLMGCGYWNGTYCSGNNLCSDFLDPYPCYARSGCGPWNGCTGIVTPCESLTNSTQCSNQMFCTWQGYSIGVGVLINANDTKILNGTIKKFNNALSSPYTNNTEVSKMVIADSLYGINFSNSENLKVHDNNFSDMTSRGIYLKNDALPTTFLTYTNISFNNFNNCFYSIFLDTSDTNVGFKFTTISNNNISTGNTGLTLNCINSTNIFNNNIILESYASIFQYGCYSDYTNITGNKFKNGNSWGIYLGGIDNALRLNISGNTFENIFEGMFLHGKFDFGTVNNNIFTNNSFFAFVLTGEVDGIHFPRNTEIKGNNFSGNGTGKGIDFQYQTINVTITKNRITGFDTGINIYPVNSLSVYNISIYDNYLRNTNNIKDLSPSSTVYYNTTKTAGTNIVGGIYIGGNYWSNYTGYDTSGDGIGDTNLPYNNSNQIKGGDWLPLDGNPPTINFTAPTLTNNTITTNLSAQINISITNAADLNTFIWNWNGTNYTFYNDSLVLMYNFDNYSTQSTSAKAVIDVSKYGNNGTNIGNNGTLVNGVAWNSSGKYGSALTFDGINDYVEKTSFSGVTGSNPDVTYVLWVKPLSMSASNNHIMMTIFSAFGSNQILAFWAEKASCGGNISVDFYANEVCSSQKLSANTWAHIALVRSGSTNRDIIYVNGVLTDNLSHSGLSLGSPLTLQIGAQSGVYNFNGTIDEVRIFNLALNSSEILALNNSNSVQNRTGLVGEWHFDENTGTTAYSSHNLLQSGKYGTAATFDGVNDCITSSVAKPSLPFTLEFWVKPNVNNPIGIFDSAPAQTEVLRNYPAGYVEWWNQNPSVALGLAAGNWYHLAFTFRQTTVNVIDYYRNGVLVTSASGASPTVFSWGSPIRFGDINYGNTPTERFNGTIDEFRIWNRSLSAAEVTQHYYSNLYKYDTDKWAFYSNQSFTEPLGNATYTYFGAAKDIAGNSNQTATRTLTIQSISPSLDFTAPTLQDNSVTTNNSVQINISITNASDLAEFKFNWNGTNYTFYNDSLVLMMNFDNYSTQSTSAKSVIDVSKYGNNGTNVANNGTLINGAVWNSSGKYGSAISFDGVDDYANVNNNFLNNPKNGTSILWVYPKATGKDGGVSLEYQISTFWCKGNVYIPFGYTSTNRVRIFVYTGSYTWYDSVNPLTINQWNQVALEWNDTGSKIYINGVLDNQSSSVTPAKVHSGHVNDVFWLGKNGASNPNSFFNGTIDELRFYSRSLSASEILELNNSYNPSNRTGLTAEWHFDENTGTIAYSSHNLLQPGKYGEGVTFNGIDDWLNTPDNLFSNPGFISLWFKTNSSSAQVLYGIQDVEIGGAATWAVPALEINNTAGNLLGEYGWYGAVNPIRTTFSVTDNKWHQVFLGYNGTYDFMYLDGALIGSRAVSTSFNTYQQIGVGAGWTLGGWNYFNGTIDEVRFWNRTLSADEITQQYYSNLYKYDTDKWQFYSNKLVTEPLGNATYTYYGLAKDIAGNFNQTATRTLTIQGFPPLLDFTAPTLADNSITTNLSAQINISITNAADIAEFKFNWNGTNYTLFDIPVKSGLKLWVKAESGITKEISNKVSAWADQSGSGNDFVQSTYSKQPVWTANAINGNPALRMTASLSQTMYTATNFPAPVTIIYVSKMNGGTNQRLLAGYANNWLLGYWGGYRDQAYFEGWVYQPTIAPDTSPYIYSATIGGSGVNSNLYLNGVLLASNQGGITGPNGLCLNGYSTCSAELSDGDVAEVIVYNRTLSDTERQNVEGYLAVKYGLQNNLPSTNPYKNMNLTQYDSDKWAFYSNQSFTEPLGNATYTYFGAAKDIAGNSNQTATRTLTIQSISPSLDFTAPTLQDNSKLSSTSAQINISILNASDLAEFKFNWNGTNYTFYNDSLALMYNFDNYSTSTGTAQAADVSKYGNNGTNWGEKGTITGAAWVPGKYGSALNFSGSSNVISISTIDISDSWTISAWFVYPFPSASCNTLTRGVNNDHQVIIQCGGTYLGTYDNYGGGGFRSSGYNTNVLSNGWHHLAAVGSGSNTSFYVDGAYVGAADYKSTTEISYIGNYQGGGQQFGTVDEVRIWTRALNASEIIALNSSNTVQNRTDLVGEWHFDENTGTTAYSNHNLLQTGRYGEGVTFNGVNDYIDVGERSSLNFVNAMTLSYWIKSFSYNSNTSIWGGELAEMGEDASYMLGTQHFNLSNVVYAKAIASLWAGSGASLTSPNYLNLNQWYHLSMTYNSSLFSLYVDGNLVNSTALTGSIPLTGNKLLIGCRNVLGGCYGSNSWFNGTIDELRAWNRSMLADEVKQQYYSNLNKYASDKWQFYSNEANLATQNYSFFASAKDLMGNENITATRTFTVVALTAPKLSGWLPDTTYVVASNISCSGTCFQIDANNVTLDCQGYMINYSQSSNGVGVNLSNYNFTTIKNCNIVQGSIQSGEAISIVNPNYFPNKNLTIYNNTINVKGGAGIYLFAVNYVNITKNTIVTSNKSAIYVFTASGINGPLYIIGNSINSTGNDPAVSLLLTARGELTGNVIYTKNNSVYVRDYFSLVNNIINSSGDVGLKFDGAGGFNVSGNNITSYLDGILLSLSFSPGQIINGNIIKTYNGDGIDTGSLSNAPYTNISNNNITSTGGYAINLNHASQITVSNNIIASTDTWDFYSYSLESSNKVYNLSLGNTNVSFTFQDIAIDSAPATVPADTANYKNISKYLNITNTSTSSWIFVNVSYNTSDLGTLPESSLKLYKYNSSNKWQAVLDTGVDTTNHIIYGVINATTGFSIFAPMDYMPINVSFVSPTPANNAVTTNTSSQINISITNIDLNQFIWNWNGTNYTFYNNDSLVLMMNFDNVSAIGDNATHAVDVGKYGNNGTLYNHAKYNSSGKYGSDMQFDGTDDYIIIPDSDTVEFGANNFTISFWAYLTSTSRQAFFHWSNNSDWSFGLDYNSVSSNKLGLWASSSGTNWNMINSDGGGNGIGTITLPQNSWVYIVVERLGNDWLMYQNGVLDKNVSGVSGTLINKANPKVIGKWFSTNQYPLNGYIDEFRIWNRSLSVAELQQQYISNLYKYDADKWAFYSNQTTEYGNYTYYGYAQDNYGNENQTEIRTLTSKALASCKSSGWTANDTYYLGNNVSSSGTCFNIDANNVTLDCQGYMINYSTGPSGGYGFSAIDVDYPAIKNCQMVLGNKTAGGTAIYIGGTSLAKQSPLIYNNTLSRAAAGTDIELQWTNNANISNNVIKNGTILISQQSNNLNIIGNFINTTSGSGIDMAAPAYTTYPKIMSNVIYSSGYSIYLTDKYSPTISYNILNSSTSYGVYMMCNNGQYALQYATVDRNNITGSAGISVAGNIGMPACPAAGTQLTNNIIRTYNGRGIEIGMEVSFSTVSNNNVTATGGYALYLGGWAGDKGPNTLSNNVISSTTTWDFYSTVAVANYNSLQNLTLGSTSISSTSFYDIALKSAPATLPADSTNKNNISKYVNVTNTSATGFINLNVLYSHSDLGNVGEPTLKLYRYNSSNAWQSTLSTGVDTTNNKVYGMINATSGFSILAPLGVSVNLTACKTSGWVENTNYYLINNVSFTGTCMQFDAQNVTLDCQGYTLTGPNTATAISVPDYDLITVKNCRMNNVSKGITRGTPSFGVTLTLTNNTITNCATTGIYLELLASQSKLTNNTIINCSKGIYAAGPSSSFAIDNVTLLNNSYGVYIDTSTDITISNSIITSSTGTGLYGMNGATATLANLTLNNSIELDENDALFSATNVSLANINLSYFYSTNVKIQKITSGIPADLSGKINISKYINITNNSAGFYSPSIKLNISYSPSDLRGALESDLKLYKYNSSNTWQLVSGSGVDTVRRVVYATTSSFSIFGVFGENTNLTACKTSGWLANTTYTLGQNVNSSGTCMQIDANNVTLDCQGYAINYSQTGEGYGVTANGYSFISIKNCNIIEGSSTGSSYGTYMLSANNISIQNNNITTYGSGSFGIYSYLMANSTVLNNRIVTNAEGIDISSCSSNRIENNIINTSGNNCYGIYLHANTNYNLLNNNTLFTGRGGGNLAIGIYSTGSARYNNVTNNQITTRGWGYCDALSLNEDCGYSWIEGNIINVSVDCPDGNGIYLSGCSNSTIINNNISDYASSCSGYNCKGIYIDSASNINIFNNSVFSNNDWDFYSSGGSQSNMVTNLYLRSANISFTSLDVALDSLTSGQPADSSVKNISKYVNITNTSATGYILLNVSYNDADLSIVSESTLKLYKYNASNAWQAVLATGVDATNKIVYGKINATSGFSVFAPMGEPLSSCQTLNTANQVYTLNANVNSSGTCFSIMANNVTINCQGHIINYSQSSGGYAVYSNGYNFTTVKNCNIIKGNQSVTWSHGFSLSNVNNITLNANNLTLIGDQCWGIYTLSNSESITLTNNNITTYGVDGYAIYLSLSNNSIVTGNTISTFNNSAYGIFIYSSDNSNISSNTITTSDTYSYGIYLSLSSNSKLTSNTVTTSGSRGYGIWIQSSSHSTFTNNTVFSNQSWDYYSTSNSQNNTVTNLYLRSANISFTSRDIALRAVTSGQPVDSGGLKNISKYINITNNSASSWAFVNISYNESDLGSVSESKLKLYRYNSSNAWELVPNSSVNTSANYVYGNITSFSIFAPMGEPLSSCQTLNTANQIYTLNNDVNSSGTCFTIQANNVTLDCQGYMINYSQSSAGYGVNITNYNFITIKNCRMIRGNSSVTAYGIFLDVSSSNILTNNTLNSNNYGIYLKSYSSNNTLTNNVATSNNYGIYLDLVSSSHNILTNNIANSNSFYGIDLEYSSSNILTNNTANSNSYGIFLDASSSNILTNNTANSNTNGGINLLYSSSNNILTNNTANSNGLYGGIYLYANSNNTLTNNVANSNYRGIYLDSSSNNILTDNTANLNSNNGIYLESSSNNVITNNTAQNNTLWDFYSKTNSLNNAVINLYTRSANVSFTSLDIALDALTTDQPADSGNLNNISKYLNMTNNSASSWAFVNISYNDSDIPSGIGETSLKLYEYNGSDWIVVNGSGVNTTEKYVYGNITSFSIFAPMGSQIANISTIYPYGTPFSNTTVFGFSNKSLFSENKTNVNAIYNSSFLFNVTINLESAAYSWLVDGNSSGSLSYLSTNLTQGIHNVTVIVDNTENFTWIVNASSTQMLGCIISNNSCDAGYSDIFHMSDISNAHAELANQSDYSYKVCCKEVSGNALDNNCSGTNNKTILHLSDVTNAHAEIATQSDYSYNVCLNNAVGFYSISCNYLSDCLGYDTCVASISGDTNAHVGDCFTDPYSTKVCCSETSCVANCTCAATTCEGSTCTDGCGGLCPGTLAPDCGGRVCGPVPNGCGTSCGTCGEGQTCDEENGICITLNVAPIIESVSVISEQDPAEGSTKTVTFNFTAYDTNGRTDLNESSAAASFAKDSVTRTVTCTKDADIDDNRSRFSCSVDMWYFDDAGIWIVSTSISDNNGSTGNNDTTSFTYNPLTAIQISPSLISWPTINRGDTDKPSIDNTTVNNTGNVNGNLQIKGIDLAGTFDSSYIIESAAFMVSTSSSGSCSGDILQNGSYINISSSSLPKGNLSTRILYYCLRYATSELIKQAYTTSLNGAWMIKIVAALAVIIPAARRRKKKLKEIKKDILKKVLSMLKDKYNINAKEVCELIEKEKLEEDIIIPVSLFKIEILGPAEIIIKYLKENLGLRFSEIARILNRDDRTIWITYRNAREKMKNQIGTIRRDRMIMPISVFSDRRLSILESVVSFLREKNLSNIEIAKLLHKDPRNVHTFFARAKKKLLL